MKLALIQLNNDIGAIVENAEKIIKLVQKAQKNGAQIAILPKNPITTDFACDLFKFKKFNNDIENALKKILEKIQIPVLIKQYINCKYYTLFLEKGKITEIKDEFSFNGKIFAQKVSKKADFLLKIESKSFKIDENLIKNAQKTAKKYQKKYIYVNNIGLSNNVVCNGQSCVLNENGEILAIAKQFEEEILIYDTSKTQAMTVTKPCIEKQVFDVLTFGLKDFCKKNGFKQVVLGLSGGIDSALTAVLAVSALGKENVLGITMPSRYSSSGSVDDSMELAKNLGIECLKKPIKKMFDTFRTDVQEHDFNDKPEENLQARLRGIILMNYSNRENRLLLSTGNKSEAAVGYCTLYGDTCGGLNLIADLYKTQVYKLSNWINRNNEIIPQSIINKAPSAELAPNQKDQDSLPEYEILDEIIKAYLNKKQSKQELYSKFDKNEVEKVFKLIKFAEFKRNQCCSFIQISKNTFGSDRCVPISHRYSF